MNYLFIHQNFPGQYVHVARHLAATGHRVLFITQRRAGEIGGVQKIIYAPARVHPGTQPYLAELDTGVANGLSVARCCDALKRDGFTPDLVVGHNGWGEILFVKDIWPEISLLGYFEFFYRSAGSDLDFDPEFPAGPQDATIRTRNAINLLGLDAADWGQTPTRWQRTQYPQRYWNHISILHEGIDSDVVRPERTARVLLEGGLSFGCSDEVITYSARNLEPYRGFHVFMRALPEVLRRRRNAHVLIVGGNGVSYGRCPAGANTWREKLLADLAGQVDLQRVHFLGKLTYHQYLAVLQVSTVHIYLTYPFVLSWSLLEAMSAGCVIIGSRTAPVEEVIVDGENGWLVEFFDIAALSEAIVRGCAERRRNEHVRQSARATVLTLYDLKRICLPRHLTLFRRLTRNLRGPSTASVPNASILSFDRHRTARAQPKTTGFASGANLVVFGRH